MDKLISISIILLFVSHLFAQIEEQDFFERVNKNYYALELTDLQNFSSWITSNVFAETVKHMHEEEIFPLEFIWVKPNDTYFIRRPLPALQDSLEKVGVRKAQENLQTEFKAILMEWSRFYSGRILAAMPADYKLESKADTVILNFVNYNDPRQSSSQMYFNQNGLILQVSIFYQDSSEKTHICPEFKYSGEFWLCTGWRVQTEKEGKVESGYHVKVISSRIARYWLPSQFQMTLQTEDVRDNIFIRVYNFRNTLINRDIQILNRGN